MAMLFQKSLHLRHIEIPVHRIIGGMNAARNIKHIEAKIRSPFHIGQNAVANAKNAALVHASTANAFHRAKRRLIDRAMGLACNQGAPSKLAVFACKRCPRTR